MGLVFYCVFLKRTIPTFFLIYCLFSLGAPARNARTFSFQYSSPCYFCRGPWLMIVRSLDFLSGCTFTFAKKLVPTAFFFPFCWGRGLDASPSQWRKSTEFSKVRGLAAALRREAARFRTNHWSNFFHSALGTTIMGLVFYCVFLKRTIPTFFLIYCLFSLGAPARNARTFSFQYSSPCYFCRGPWLMIVRSLDFLSGCTFTFAKKLVPTAFFFPFCWGRGLDASPSQWL